MPSPKTPPSSVSVEDRAALERMARSQMLPARVVLAARGLVMAVDGVASIVIARRLAVCRHAPSTRHHQQPVSSARSALYRSPSR